jgi:hypothetical protein
VGVAVSFVGTGVGVAGLTVGACVGVGVAVGVGVEVGVGAGADEQHPAVATTAIKPMTISHLRLFPVFM